MDAEYASLGDELRARQEEYRRTQQNSESGGWSSTGLTGVTPANGSTVRPEFISENNYAWTPAPSHTAPPPGPPQQAEYPSGTFGSYTPATFNGQNGTYSAGTPHPPNGSQPADSAPTANDSYPSDSFNGRHSSYPSGTFNGLISPEGLTDGDGDPGVSSTGGSYAAAPFDGQNVPTTAGFPDPSATGGPIPVPGFPDTGSATVVNVPNTSKFTAPPQQPDSHTSASARPNQPGLPALPSAYITPTAQGDDSQPATAILPKTDSLPALPTRTSTIRQSTHPVAQSTAAARPTPPAAEPTTHNDRSPETAALHTAATETPQSRTPPPETPAIPETPAREPRSAEALASLLAEQLALAEKLSSAAASGENPVSLSPTRQTPEPETHAVDSSNDQASDTASAAPAPTPSQPAVPRLPAPDADNTASAQAADHADWFSTIADENAGSPSPTPDGGDESGPRITDRTSGPDELPDSARDETHADPSTPETPRATTRSDRRRNGSAETRPPLTELHTAPVPSATVEPPAEIADSRTTASASTEAPSRRSRRRSADNSEINIHLIMQLLLASDELHDVATRAEAGEASIEEFVHTARQARDASLAVISAWYGGTDRMVKFAQSLLHAAGEAD
ncbi:hypothetical protein [Nocardia paucivorans]|uniref:hypothetical protein n=1 Tax=Nocardia paucivorans TaxID=114259 RepID=UPI0002FDAF17|nr:hypothetical protein [Nocardia paucivorans]